MLQLLYGLICTQLSSIDRMVTSSSQTNQGHWPIKRTCQCAGLGSVCWKSLQEFQRTDELSVKAKVWRRQPEIQRDCPPLARQHWLWQESICQHCQITLWQAIWWGGDFKELQIDVTDHWVRLRNTTDDCEAVQWASRYCELTESKQVWHYVVWRLGWWLTPG